MDKNQSIGLVLISLLLLVYFYFFSPTPEPPQEPKTDSTQVIADKPQFIEKDTIRQIEEPEVNDSLKEVISKQKYGVFHAGITGEDKEILLENDEVKIFLKNQGAVINRVELKKFLDHEQKQLVLLDEKTSQMDLLVSSAGRPINLTDLYFKSEIQERRNNETDTLIVKFILEVEPGKRIEKVYQLPPNGYQLMYSLNFVGLDNLIDDTNVQFKWREQMKRFEKHLDASYHSPRKSSTINYYLAGESFESLDAASTETEIEEVSQPIKWATIKHKFFNAAIIADDLNFTGANFKTTVNPEDTVIIKNASMVLNVPASEIASGKGNFRFYFGPNNYQILKKVTDGFSKNVDLGWKLFSWVNKFLIIPIFNFLENYIGNYGVIIIILVLFIKLLLSPLSYKSYISMAKTKVLKPELDDLKAKYGDDMQKIQAEQMKLYRQVGVNPLSGCIPVVLQMPILLAMFNFFPNSVELRQESFLWAADLSTYDSVLQLPFSLPFYGSHVSLFTLLMTMSTILYTWSNNQMTTVQGPMKTIGYIMPITFMFVLNSYPAGLTFYYFVSTIVTFGQQMIIRKFVDEDKIRKVLDENRLKNKDKKKSKFQLKLEEAMKASEAAKKNKKKNR